MRYNIVTMVVCAVVIGCGSKEEGPSAPAPAPASVMPNMTAPAAVPLSANTSGTLAPPPAASQNFSPTDPTVPVADIPVDLAALDRAVAEYCKKTQANPYTLDDLVKQGFLKALPKLPPGKVFVIDDVTFKVKIDDIIK